MNKSLKILVISLICVSFIFTTNCFAVNIDMNLSSNLVDSNETDLNTTNSYNDTSSNSTQANETNSKTNTSSAYTSTTSKTANVPDSLQALPESELGLTNILNILLIAIGIVLILLSIAIFIRLKH